MGHIILVYFSTLLTLFSLIFSQCSDGGDGGSSDATTQSLVTLQGRVDDGLAMSPIANAQGRKFTDASGCQDIQGALVPPIDRANNLIVYSADAHGRLTFILVGDTPLVSTQVG
jgi:hypothetical protein